MCSRMKLLVHGARQIVQVAGNHERVLKGKAMSELAVLNARNNDSLSIVVNRDGCIEDIGQDSAITAKYQDVEFEETIDASGMCVIPGLVDGHTHPVWAGDRVHEFSMKLAGASYMEVHAAGGGIHFTVNHTQAAPSDDLFEFLKPRLLRMLKSGTTMVECKSGYGLDTENEVKMLRVLERAKKELPIEISSTYCGAHAVPKGSSSEAATNNVIQEQIPAIKQLIDNGELNVDAIDVFCEKGVFSTEESRRILQAGRNIGLRLNFHGDELHPTASAEMGASLKADAISHLEEISRDGIEAMAKNEVVAVILPSTAYILRLKCPPVREMIEAGVPVALGTDFNPNAHCTSMAMIMHLACVLLKMNLNEALAASTLNAAASLGKSSTHGSLEKGKIADMLLLDAPRWEHLVYQFGDSTEVVAYVIKRGSIVAGHQYKC